MVRCCGVGSGHFLWSVVGRLYNIVMLYIFDFPASAVNSLQPVRYLGHIAMATIRNGLSEWL